ncbi:Latrophilin-3, partial [Stegodyphus mimosarum]
MLYLDCLAQIFSEISTLAAYLCILISSAHSYSVDEACVNSSPKLCVAVCVLIQFFFQGTFLFLLFESVRMCSVLKEFVPGCCSPSSPFSLIFFGFGIPAVMTTVSAAIASDEFSDGDDNCWLNINGRAMLPSVLPNLIFGALTLFLLLSMFDADQPRSDVSPIRLMRGRVFLKTRWA